MTFPYFFIHQHLGGLRKQQEKKYVYNPADLRAALSVIHHCITKKSGREKYVIPRSTLQFQLSNKFLDSFIGPPPLHSKDEEQVLVKWVTDCS